MYMYVIDVVLYTRYPLATLLSTVMVLTSSLDAIRQADKIVLFRQGSTTPSASQALALGSLGTMTAQPQVSFGRHAWLISPHTPPFIPTPLENKSYAHRLSEMRWYRPPTTVIVHSGRCSPPLQRYNPHFTIIEMADHGAASNIPHASRTPAPPGMPVLRYLHPEILSRHIWMNSEKRIGLPTP